MYSRAPRNPVSILGSTPIHIGPGTYDTVTLESNKQSLDSYAPFLALSLREDIFKNVNETPGPGEYNLAVNSGLAKGGSSLANKAKRFADKLPENPGPGSYLIENIENTRPVVEMKISKQRVKLNRKKNPPSIQDPKLAYGFEEAANGELIPQAPPERDSTMGPAYYNANLIHNPSQYKGIHFAKYSSKRTDFSGKAGPGPGEYDTAESVLVDVEHFHLKNLNNKKPELNVPRYPEIVLKTVEKESVPGPGKYEQKRLFDNASVKSSDIYGFDIERPPFGTQARRFIDNKTVAPGPGAYSDQRSALSSLQKVHSLKKTPFLQSSSRFNSMSAHLVRSAPGPGQYRINGFAEDNLRKAIVDSRRKPAFGQSAPRKFDLSQKEEVPGPAQYQVKEITYRPKKENFSSNFASNTKQRELQFEDTPGPTAYDVPKAYDALINVKRGPPRTKNASKRQEMFNVVSKRDLDLVGSYAIEVPGPGHYENLVQKASTHIAKLNDKRWKDEKKDKIPGPADYDLSPLYKDTVLKGTFNATLNNPLIIKRQKASSDSELSQSKFGLGNLQKMPEALQVA
ncbi:unnamed protein product [Brachionus calyciflorus]|uniref:Sperm-tail PG-rich repeat-containing protein 2 n=1 Tax=Brachionus calyciflorus TaxID=104777 RepID=A0A814J5P9_9BILA|nr:unnamed protein product [Brachionus calyciflorus]